MAVDVGELQARLSLNTAQYAAAMNGAVKTTQAAAQQMAGATNAASAQMMASLQRIGEVLAGVFSAQLLGRFFDAAVQGFASLVSEGIRFNSTMEQNQLGIASLVTAVNDVVDAQGNQLRGVEAIQAAQRITADLYRQIQRDAVVTVATTQELVGAFQQALAPAQAAGLTLDQTRLITKDIVLAWGAMGRPMQMVAQETRALLSGTIDRNAELARALGITHEMVEQAKAEGRLYDLLSEKLAVFRDSAALVGNTFQGLLSTIKDVAQMLGGAAFAGVFTVVREEVQRMRDALIDANGQIRPEITERVRELAQAFEGVARSVVSMMHELVPAFAFMAAQIPRVILAWRIALAALTADVPAIMKALQGVQVGGVPQPTGGMPELRPKATPVTADTGFAQLQQQRIAAQQAAESAILKSEGNIMAAFEMEAQAVASQIRAKLADQLAAVDKLEKGRELTTAQAAARRVELEQTAAAQMVKNDADAYAKRTAQIEQFVSGAASIISALGPQFAGVGRALDLSAYLAKTQAAIQTLRGVQMALAVGGTQLSAAFQAAGVSAADVGAAITTLQGSMADATKRGAAPLAESMEKLTDAGKQLEDFARKGTAALANFSNSAKVTDQAIRALLDGAMQTRGFDEMGREVTALMREITGITQTAVAFEAGLFNVGDAAKETAENIKEVGDATKDAAREMKSATDEMNEVFRAMAESSARLRSSLFQATQNIANLRHQLAQVGLGATFAFVQDPKLRQQIEDLRQKIVDATGATRIALVKQLEDLLQANEAQLNADRVAAQIMDEWRQLDERRNQLLEQIKAEIQKMNEAIGQFQREAFQRMVEGLKKKDSGMQHGGVVPGVGSGDTVPAMLEPGEVVIPRTRAAAALALWPDLAGGSTRAGHFQHGGVVGAGGAVSVTVNGSVTEVNARRLAREIAAAERLERARGTI